MTSSSERTCLKLHGSWQWPSTAGEPPAGCECPDCLAAWEKAQAEHAKEAEQRAGDNWRRLCPPDYREVDFSLLLDQAAYDKVQVWRYGPRGLLAHGKTRLGKTRAVWQLVKRLLFEGHQVAAYNCVSFGHRVMALGDNPRQFVEWIERLHKVVPVVFLDDPFGKGKLTERAIAELFGLVENRMAHRLPILVTMNMTGAQITKYIGGDRAKPLVARLMECCETVAFTGKKGG